MNRRVWTGVVAGVLAATVLLSVGLGAYRAGQDHEVVTRTVGDGQVVRVIDGHGWGYGPGPGFFLIPLLGIVLVVLLLRGRRGYGGWHGPYGGGPPWAQEGREAAFQEWHRRAHEDGAPGTSAAAGPPSRGAGAPDER